MVILLLCSFHTKECSNCTLQSSSEDIQKIKDTVDQTVESIIYLYMITSCPKKQQAPKQTKQCSSDKNCTIQSESFSLNPCPILVAKFNCKLCLLSNSMTHVGQTFKFNDYQISFKGVNLFMGHPVYFLTYLCTYL